MPSIDVCKLTIPSIICIVVLPFVPESPRWLVHQGRREEARRIIALTCANGDENDLASETIYQEIVDTIEWEKNAGETLTWKEMVRTPSARRRVLLAVSAATFSVIAGNVAASYYLGSMLTNAGVTNTTTQLQIVSVNELPENASCPSTASSLLRFEILS